MRKQFFILKLLCVFVVSDLTYSQAHAATFEDYIRILREHPQVTAILAESEKFKELSDGSMGLPDPMIMLGVDNVPASDPAFDRFLPTSKIIGFSQKIPSYSLRKAKSEKQERLSERQQLIADYTLQRLEAIFIATLTELNTVRQIEGFAKKQLEYYIAMEDYLKGRLEAGSAVYGRFSEVDVERTDVEQRLNNLKAERINVEAELVRLVGEVPVIQLPEISHVNWNHNAKNIYPVLITEENLSITSKDIKVSNAAFMPNYGINAKYKIREEGAMFAGDDWFSIHATVSVPLWAYWNQQPKLRAAKAKHRNAEFAYEDSKRRWIKKLKALEAKRDVSMDNILLLKEKQKALKEMIGAAERNYEAGNATLESVLDAQIDELTIASKLAKQNSLHIKLSVEFNSYLLGKKS